MAKLQRKSAKLFAESASAGIGGIAQFGSLAAGEENFSKDPDVIQALNAFKLGWAAACLGNKSPSLEDRNALDYLLSYQQAYIMQRGIPEWLSSETYYKGSVVSMDNGYVYVSKTDNNTGNDPSADTNETNWIAFPTPAQLALKVAKAGDVMSGPLYLTQSGVNVPYMNPTGIIVMSPLSSLTGFLLCNGQAVSRTTYANLYAAIGVNFGAGDGSTTFNVPDYRGCFLRGLGGDSANDTYTKQAMGAPDIQGAISGNNGMYLATGAFAKGDIGAGGLYNGSTQTNIYTFKASSSNSVYGAASEIRPVNYAVNYFIKF